MSLDELSPILAPHLQLQQTLVDYSVKLLYIYMYTHARVCVCVGWVLGERGHVLLNLWLLMKMTVWFVLLELLWLHYLYFLYVLVVDHPFLYMSLSHLLLCQGYHKIIKPLGSSVKQYDHIGSCAYINKFFFCWFWKPKLANINGSVRL